MRRYSWQIALGLSLLMASVVLYLIHYAIFRDAHHIFLYLVGDIAFLPIQVLLVTLIISGLLEKRERVARMDKLNMVIGVFFSEVGTQLLAYLSDFDPGLGSIKQELIVNGEWSDQEFARVARRLKNHNYAVDIGRVRLEDLRGFLIGKRNFLLSLLENQSLLEHEAFTDLLWAILHLTEELASRKDLSQLPQSDLDHLAGDSKRAYGLLVRQWLDYMKHLKESYPYLFSLAMRTNPFDESASVIVG